LPSEWKTHTLIWRNKADLEKQSLDDLFNSLKIYEAEVKYSSSTGTTTQNLAFVSSSNTGSTTELVSAAASVFAIFAKMLVTSLPNVDSLSNAHIDVDDLEEMDLRWQMAMLTMKARRFLQKTCRNLGANGPTSMGFDMSKVECYNCHRKGHFARERRSPKDSKRNGAAELQRRTVLVETSTSNALVSQCDGVPSCSKACSKAYAQLHSQYDKLTANFCKSQFDVISYQTGLESVEARLLVYKQNESVFEENIKLLILKCSQEIMLYQTNEKTGLGYNSQVFIRAMFDCDDYRSSKSDCKSWPPTSLYDRFQPSDGYHVFPPPYAGTFMTPKPDLVFNTAPTVVENDHHAVNVHLSPTKPEQALSHTNRPTTPIIEDWVSDSEDESETKALQIALSFVQSSEQVKSPRHSIQPVETSIPAATPKLASLKPMAQPTPRNHAHRGNHKQYASLTHTIPQKHMVPAAVFTQSKPVFITAVRPVSTDVPKIKMTRPRHANLIVTKSKSPIRRHITCSPSPKTNNSPPKVTVVKAPVVSTAQLDDNISYLSDFEELNGGYVAFGGDPKGGKISGKGKIKTGRLEFDDVYFVKELKFNLFSVSQMCDKKNSVLFTDTECLVLSPDFKLPDESQVLLRVPRENDMYNVNLKNIVPSGDLTCLFAKVTLDESNLWHKMLGHINFKTINKLVKCNLVRGLPLKVFKNDNTCVACKKGKQHRASCKTKPVSSVDQPLYMLHMDLFGPTFVKSLNKKNYCFVVTNDYSRFTWVFFLATKDETSPILKTFITGLENQLSLKVKVIRTDNGTEFKNHDLNQFCGMKEIKREFSVLRTPQQNGIAKKKNMTLIEAARTMLADSLLPIPFWAEAVNTACCVQNKVSTNPQNNDGDAAFDGNEHDFDAKKPESEVSVSPSSSAQSRKQDDKTKKEARGKIPTVGQNSLNNTNTFSVTGPTNATASPTYGKSSSIDASQLPNDPDIPELEDIAYSDDEDDVGAEADFNNLETSITEEPKRSHWYKWVYMNKKDERGIVVRNKARLVIQGHIQEEGIDYKKVFAPVARIEAIRLFLAYASFMGFMVYQMDVKSAFLYGTIKKEVYVCQPLGFEYPDHPDKVYKVVKALYGLHQAPRAWYETLANYLLENGFQRGKINQTLFIKRQKGDILMVQIYVDDIIFGATNKGLCKSFEKLMKDKFQMSSIGELTFFLGLQVKQKKDGIIIIQDKYVAEILRKFGLTEGKSSSTPIDTERPLLKDPDGEDVDVHTYRSMIGSLMYLTLLRPDIMFAVCACARFQVTPKASYLHAVKRIFRYLKGKPHLGLWYPKDSPFYLVAYSYSDYAGASLDRKSTTKGCQFLGCRLISWQCKKQTIVATSSTEAEYVVAASCCAQVLWIQNQLLDYSDSPLLGVNTPRSDEDRLELMELMVFLLPMVEKGGIIVNVVDLQVSAVRNMLLLDAFKPRLGYDPVKQVNDVTRLQALVDRKKVVVTKATIRDSLRLDDAEGVDYLPNEEIFVELARMGYEKPSTKLMFYKAFFSSRWKFLIHTILQCMSAKRTSWNEFSSSMASAVICLSSGVFGVETPLFEGMLVEQEIDEQGDADEHVEEVNIGDAAEGDVSVARGEVSAVTEEPSIPSPTPPTPPSQPPQDIPSTSQVQPPSPQPQPQQATDFPMSLLQEAMDACAALTRRVEHLEYDKVAQALEITKLKRKVKKLEKMNKWRMIAEMDQDDAVVLKDDKDEDKEVDDAEEHKVDGSAQDQWKQAESQAEIYKIDMDHANKVLSMQEDETEPAKVQKVVDVVTTAKLITEVVTAASETVTTSSETITTDIDWDEAIDHVKRKAKEDPAVKRYQAMKRKPQTEAQARKNMMMYLKNVVGFKMDYFKGMSYDDIRLIFEAKFNSNLAFLLKTKSS
nr:putative ribonuclease H-like domain-containing protein [Tanacetum cinerariifolium]